MYIGNQILELRKKQGITQEVLAAEMGVTVGAVSKWETGKSVPDIMMLCALADFFEVTTDELLGRIRGQEFIVCDDALFIRTSMKEILAKNGYQNVRVAENGKALLAALEEKVPNCIFLDISLPDKNGLDVLKQIKEEYKEIKVVMVSGDSTDITKNKAITYGAEAYITKPFLPEHVACVLNELGL